MNIEEKRLFFGIEVTSPWPISLPRGRTIDENHRHMTLAFLGNTPYERLKELMPQFPFPSFEVGFVGYFDECIFLPKRNPQVVAWHVHLSDESQHLEKFQQELTDWLISQDFVTKNTNQKWLPHVTLCRSPFDGLSWMKEFHLLPLMATHIHLYESLGHSKYRSCWEYTLLPPFEEISHMADIAFHVIGKSVEELHAHAEIALAFKFPSLLPFLSKKPKEKTLDAIIMDLNDRIGKADTEIGCPFKAVSFHGDILNKDNLLHWEMIVDV